MTDTHASSPTAPADPADPADPASHETVALVTLGCARNEVDSEEVAARLDAAGFRLVDEPSQASTVVVNTCGFVEQAKLDSIETIRAAGGAGPDGATKKRVVAIGCLAERYGRELADSMPEADAVLGFDSYPRIADRLREVLDGHAPAAHVPTDRRRLLPVAPVDRQQATGTVSIPGHAPAEVDAPDLTRTSVGGPRVLRRRLDGRPYAPVKIASGCDRRCAFCAIPSFRGAFASRRPADVLTEVRWLADTGVKEVFLVSENSTSYGKDLGDLRLLETMLGELAAVDGIERVRVSYLQPAEMRPTLIDAMTSTPGVVPYFDLSFQHAAGPLLRRMRRFGDGDAFLDLIARIRSAAPTAGIRSNVIVGFPGETEDDVQQLTDFLSAAELDAIGVFGYSDEDGTEAERLDGKIDEDDVADRVDAVGGLADHLMDARATARIGERVQVLVEGVDDDGMTYGRAAHQGPDVDGITRLGAATYAIGQLVDAEVVGNTGVDLDAFAPGVGSS